MRAGEDFNRRRRSDLSRFVEKCRVAAIFLLATSLFAEESPVGNAVLNARGWLRAQQRDDGSFPTTYDCPGANALAVWTLLECGVPHDDPAVLKTIQLLRDTGDPTRSPGGYPNYSAALTLVALHAWYDRQVDLDKPADAAARLKAMRARVSAKDRELVRRLLRYVRECATEKRWGYAKTGKLEVPMVEARVLGPVKAFDPAALRNPGVPEAVKWSGDNSNAQYGWLGIRAAARMGEGLGEDAFILGELKRLLGTRRAKGDAVTVRIRRRGEEGFGGLWPKDEVQESVVPGGWAYGPLQAIPTMTTGAIACLAYAWHEAESRGLMTDELRAQAREALLGGLAALSATTPDAFPDC